MNLCLYKTTLEDNNGFLMDWLNYEDMKVPQFLYVPKVNTVSNQKMIIETRKNIYMLVYDFEEEEDLLSWNNSHSMDELYTMTYKHPKYPFIIAVLKMRDEIENKRLVRICKMAADWFVQFKIKKK